MVTAPDAGVVQGLSRSLRPADIVMLTLSAISPAASVFITGAAIVHLVGTGAAMAAVLGGLAALLASLLYAELGSAYPSAGGVYPGIGMILGDGPAFAVSMLGAVTAPAFLAFASLGLADYVAVLVPGAPRLPTAFLALAAAVAIGVRPIRRNAALTGAFLALEVLALLVLSALTGLHPARPMADLVLHPVALDVHGRLAAVTPWKMVLATLAGAYACAGSGLALYFVEDMEGDPRRVGRIVLLVGVLAVALVALPLVLLAASLTDLPRALAAGSPIAFLLQLRGGRVVASAVSLAIALAAFNNIVANLLSYSRFLYATDRDRLWGGLVGSRLSLVRGGSRTPWRATVALGLAAALCCLAGQRSLLTILSGEVFSAALVAAAVLVGRGSGRTGALSFRAPFFPATPVVGLLLIGLFVCADWKDPTSGRTGLLLLSALFTGSLLYHAMRAKRSKAPAPSSLK